MKKLSWQFKDKLSMAIIIMIAIAIATSFMYWGKILETKHKKELSIMARVVPDSIHLRSFYMKSGGMIKTGNLYMKQSGDTLIFHVYEVTRVASDSNYILAFDNYFQGDSIVIPDDGNKWWWIPFNNNYTPEKLMNLKAYKNSCFCGNSGIYSCCESTSKIEVVSCQGCDVKPCSSVCLVTLETIGGAGVILKSEVIKYNNLIYE
jgi:hypothetical protein